MCDYLMFILLQLRIELQSMRYKLQTSDFETKKQYYMFFCNDYF